MMKRFYVRDEEFLLPENYTISRFVKKGAYGIVVTGNDIENDQEIAIKKCTGILQPQKNDELTRIVRKRMLRELEILHFFSVNEYCENIVRLVNVYYYGYDVYLVFEQLDFDLRDLLKSAAASEPLEGESVKIIAYQILLSIVELHRHNLLHRDVKPENLLYSASEQTVKLCDFGFSRYFQDFFGENDYNENDEQSLMSTHVVATRWYRPPELLLGCLHVSKGIDMWGFGCILGELLRPSHQALFPGRNRINQLTRIVGVLGSQKEEDLFGCEKGKLWIQTFRNKEKKSFRKIIFQHRKNIEDIILSNLEEEEEEDISEVEDECEAFELAAVDLLGKCLQFNIKNRISAEEAIRHEFFKDIFDERDIETDESVPKFTTVYRHDMTSEEIFNSIMELIDKVNPIEYQKMEIVTDNLIIG